jgi:hypothetical protein
MPSGPMGDVSCGSPGCLSRRTDAVTQSQIRPSFATATPVTWCSNVATGRSRLSSSEEDETASDGIAILRAPVIWRAMAADMAATVMARRGFC